MIVGIDEVGRGPLAGPVVACALAFHPDVNIRHRVQDSKALTDKARKRLFPQIQQNAWYAIGWASAAEIDQLNIRQATHLAMRRAMEKLDLKIVATDIVIDGHEIPAKDDRMRSLIKADALVPEVSGASIIAKVLRDRYMRRLHAAFPYYDWDSNAGYGTPKHLLGVQHHGISPHHRKSFRIPLPKGFMPQA